MSGGGPCIPSWSTRRRRPSSPYPRDVLLVEPAEGSPGVTYPRGFLAAGVAAGLKESGRPDVGVVAVAPEYRAETVGAAVFTRNSFAAAPVIVSRKGDFLDRLTAVVMNSGNANACHRARRDGRRPSHADGDGCGPGRSARPGGSGIDGSDRAPLDTPAVLRGIDAAVAALTSDGGQSLLGGHPDHRPLSRRAARWTYRTRDGVVRVGATAKGAGMIAPGMATMLCVVTTDAVLTPTVARSLLVARGEPHLQPHLGRRADEHQRLRLPHGQRGFGDRALGRSRWLSSAGPARGAPALGVDDGGRRRGSHQSGATAREGSPHRRGSQDRHAGGCGLHRS